MASTLQAYLTDMLTDIVSRDRVSRADGLLPFVNVKSALAKAMA